MTTFATDLHQLVAVAVDTAERRTGRHAARLSRAERVEIVRELDRVGVFQLRYAAETVARHLGVSRASVFNYLRESRHCGSDSNGGEMAAEQVGGRHA